VESVLPSGIESVVVDACWREFSQYEWLSWIRRVVLPRTAIQDGGCYGSPRAGGYKWQYILITAFSSYIIFLFGLWLLSLGLEQMSFEFKSGNNTQACFILHTKLTFNCAVIFRIILIFRAFSTFGRFIVITPLSPICDSKTSSFDSADDEGDETCNSNTQIAKLAHNYICHMSGWVSE